MSDFSQVQDIQVDISQTALSLQYQKMILDLQKKLKKEEALRQELEEKNKSLVEAADKYSPQKSQRQRIKKTPAQKKAEREAYQQRQLTGLKKDGKPIPHAGEGITSYTEFKAMYDHLWNLKQYKLWLMWCLGTATGLRISDLSQLKWGYFFEKGNYRERFPKVEQKTGKLNNILITEFMRESIDKYLCVTNAVKIGRNSVTNVGIKETDLVFPSRKQFKYDDNLSEDENEIRRKKKEYSYSADLSQRLKNYGKEIGLQHKSSHSMRHSFCSIVQSCYKGNADIGTLDVVSMLLNHYDLKTTARYCGLLDRQQDEARTAVSDFLMGKTDIDILEI